MARNDHELRIKRLEHEINLALEKAKDAELESKLLLASHFYKIASELSRKNDDYQKVKVYHQRAESLLNKDINLKADKHAEYVKDKAKKIVSSIRGRLKITLKVAELAVDKEKNLDAFMYYDIAAHLFSELGDSERAIACKQTASHYKSIAIEMECKKIADYYEQSLSETGFFK
ncbi:MAG: hypothetical protein EAX96_08890 [Candidatus Lokiarchaeota archaeon]|nr:hypothetical protein [Candidatus Lokiarchaeota archaeon]